MDGRVKFTEVDARKWLVEYEQVKSVPAIAKAFGAHPETVTKWLKKLGVDLHGNRHFSADDVQAWAAAYDETKSIFAVSRKFGVHHQTVVWRLRKAGVRMNAGWLSLEEMKEVATSKGGECLAVGYWGCHVKYLWKCGSGHTWESKYSQVKAGSWCPHCAFTHSKGELDIFEAVKVPHPDAVSGQRQLLPTPSFELDIYVPSLRKAIEFDGVWYHSLPGAQARDGRKDAECGQAGIKLLRIPEMEYRADKTGTKQKVLEWLAMP